MIHWQFGKGEPVGINNLHIFDKGIWLDIIERIENRKRISEMLGVGFNKEEYLWKQEKDNA